MNVGTILKSLPMNQIFSGEKSGGDFDLILMPRNLDTTKLACFEFKRIKVTAKDFESDKVNKINGLHTLKGQIESRLKMGFYLVYAVIIVQSDIRNRKTPNTILRPSTDETNDLLFHEFKKADIPREAGVIFCRIDQPTGNKYSMNFSIVCHRLPQIQNQPSGLSSRFMDRLNNYT